MHSWQTADVDPSVSSVPGCARLQSGQSITEVSALCWSLSTPGGTGVRGRGGGAPTGPGAGEGGRPTAAEPPPPGAAAVFRAAKPGGRGRPALSPKGDVTERSGAQRGRASLRAYLAAAAAQPPPERSEVLVWARREAATRRIAAMGSAEGPPSASVHRRGAFDVWLSCGTERRSPGESWVRRDRLDAGEARLGWRRLWREWCDGGGGEQVPQAWPLHRRELKVETCTSITVDACFY